jgi:hypothetical protein
VLLVAVASSHQPWRWLQRASGSRAHQNRAAMHPSTRAFAFTISDRRWMWRRDSPALSLVRFCSAPPVPHVSCWAWAGMLAWHQPHPTTPTHTHARGDSAVCVSISLAIRQQPQSLDTRPAIADQCLLPQPNHLFSTCSGRPVFVWFLVFCLLQLLAVLVLPFAAAPHTVHPLPQPSLLLVRRPSLPPSLRAPPLSPPSYHTAHLGGRDQVDTSQRPLRPADTRHSKPAVAARRPLAP